MGLGTTQRWSNPPLSSGWLPAASPAQYPLTYQGPHVDPLMSMSAGVDRVYLEVGDTHMASKCYSLCLQTSILGLHTLWEVPFKPMASVRTSHPQISVSSSIFLLGSRRNFLTLPCFVFA